MDPKFYFYPESRFGGFTDIDGTIAFFLRVNALSHVDAVALDVGCGRGAGADDPVRVKRDLLRLRGRVGNVIGIDVDPAASVNSNVDEFRLIVEDHWPVDTGTIDLVVCDNVLEHIKDVDFFFGELARVVRPGGYVCIRTPNAHNYIAMLSKLIPNRYHTRVLSVAQKERREQDIFPTYYRCNTVRALRQALENAGFTSLVYGYEAEPSYLSFSYFAYWLGVLHQRFAPSAIKPALFAFGQKTR